MFPRFAEYDVRPTLFGKAQIDPGWRNVDELITMIVRKVVMRFAFKLSQHLFVVTLDPAGCRHVNCFELALDLVLITQAMRDNFELQRPNGT